MDREKERWLAIRKEVATRINPSSAEVMWCYAAVGDPYGLYPEESGCYGRAYYARAPGDDVWVSFGDLPKATRDAPWATHWRKLAFPAGLCGPV